VKQASTVVGSPSRVRSAGGAGLEVLRHVGGLIAGRALIANLGAGIPRAARDLARACLALPLAALLTTAAAQSAEPGAHIPLRYTITLVTSDTSGHLLGEVETGWRLRTVEPVAMRLDSAFRVVRVLVDGKPNTRISRTMYARQGGEVIVPHEKAPGDTLTTRVRYHGIPRGGFRVGPDRTGARGLAAETAGDRAPLWLPVPAGEPGRVTVTWNVQASEGQRAIATGVLTGVDTLSYGHTTWHFRLDRPVPLGALAVAAGRYAVTTLPHSTCGEACVPVTLWTPPDDSAAAAAGAFRRAGAMVDFMSRRLGPFPYPSLAHVASPLVPAGRPGAMVVLYDGTRVHAGEVTETDVARATAAQWLGNAVSDSATGGPSDAAASYLALLWTRQDRPGPTGATLTRGVDAVSRLHRLVGDSVFFRGLRRYVEANRDAAAPPGALERAMAEAAGKAVDWSWRPAVGAR
jgi:aminopeptidase N